MEGCVSHPDTRVRVTRGVIYVGASPVCAKNEAYARRQAAQFLAGKSAPDFAAEDYEVNFKGRATLDDLTPEGTRQMML